MTAQPSPAKNADRDPFFDNAKLLAMVLVVVGHAWQPLKDSRAVWAAYLFLYTFHMPVFIILSGYFSRTFASKPRQVRRLVTGIAVPYAVFETVYTLYGNAVDDRGNDISIFSPWYLTWFLIALFVWRLTAPVWLTLRWQLALGLSVVVALLGAASDLGPALNLDRVLQFLPFFVIGLLLRPGHWELLRARWVRLAAVPVLAAGLVAAYWLKGRMTSEWAVRSKSWAELGVEWPAGVAMSLIMLVCSLLLCVAFLAWVPRRHTWFTALGAGTLCAYLLHGLIIRTAAWEGWYEPEFWHTPAGELLVTGLGVLLALGLTSPPVRRLFRPVMEPRMEWAFRPQSAAPAADRPTGPPAEPRGGQGAGTDVQTARAASEVDPEPEPGSEPEPVPQPTQDRKDREDGAAGR